MPTTRYVLEVVDAGCHYTFGTDGWKQLRDFDASGDEIEYSNRADAAAEAAHQFASMGSFGHIVNIIER